MDGSGLVQDFALELEIVFCIVVGDILHHLVDEFHLALRKLSCCNVFAQNVAEDSAEVLVTWI